MMGGSIAVESKKGVGATFTVEIPLELPEQVIQSEQKQHLHRDLTGIHVLMAEDLSLIHIYGKHIQKVEFNSQDVELDAVVRLLLLNWRTVIRKREYSH